MDSAKKESYGKELILDLSKCDVLTFNRESIGNYFEELCKLIDMEAQDRHFWDDEGVDPEECQTDPKTTGVSAVQFILTSTIVLHSLTKLGTVYVNIFSCKDFDTEQACMFTVEWFRSLNFRQTTVTRH